jgi:hypothetical protein
MNLPSGKRKSKPPEQVARRCVGLATTHGSGWPSTVGQNPHALVARAEFLLGTQLPGSTDKYKLAYVIFQVGIT